MRALRTGAALRISDLGPAATGQFEAFRGVFVNDLLVCGREERSSEVEDRPVFDFA